jgi:hypothetical protein
VIVAAVQRPPADALALTTVAYGAVLTGWTAVDAARGTGVRPLQSAAATILGLAGAALSAVYLLSLASGHRSDEPWVSVGYALAALLILPLAWPKSEPRPQLASATATIATLAFTVVVLRLRVTW